MSDHEKSLRNPLENVPSLKCVTSKIGYLEERIASKIDHFGKYATSKSIPKLAIFQVIHFRCNQFRKLSIRVSLFFKLTYLK